MKFKIHEKRKSMMPTLNPAKTVNPSFYYGQYRGNLSDYEQADKHRREQELNKYNVPTSAGRNKLRKCAPNL